MAIACTIYSSHSMEIPYIKTGKYACTVREFMPWAAQSSNKYEGCLIFGVNKMSLWTARFHHKLMNLKEISANKPTQKSEWNIYFTLIIHFLLPDILV